MNLGLSTKLVPILQSAFQDLDISPSLRPLVNNQTIPDSYWISGFVEAEGCFFL